MTLTRVALLLALGLVACDPPRRSWPDAGAVFAEASLPVADEPGDSGESIEGRDSGVPQGKLYPSRRCGECHGRQRDEWARSAHSRSSSVGFNAALEKTPAAARAGCGGCHRPLEAGGPRVAVDGVACDACHTATEAGEGGAPLRLRPELATRFGPFKDSKDHHFHRVGFSAFVTGDGLCVACHQDPAGAALPVYTTGAEWHATPKAKPCVACHMPGFNAIAAKGEKVRPVSHHDFGSGAKAEALAAAVSLQLKGERNRLTVTLTNTGAAHALPTGRPERRLRLEVHWKSAADAPVGDAQQAIGRRLVDADGGLSPSFLAVREESDGRLLPGQPRALKFDAPPQAAAAVVQLYYEPFDAELSRWFAAEARVLVHERREALSR